MSGLKYRAMKDIGAPLLFRLSENKKRKKRKKYRKSFKENTWSGPPLKSSKELKRIMSRHYFLARYAAGHFPVAWVSSGAPVEILRPFDFYTIYPENHGAVCGARRVGREMCEIAESHGFHQDLCSYAKIDIAHSFSGRSPVGNLPKPDIMMVSNNICQTILHWFSVVADYYHIPLLIFDTPFVDGAPSKVDLDYMTNQLEGFIPILEQHSGKRFKMKKLRETVSIALRTSRKWAEILNSMKAEPAPMTIFDAFVHLAPIVSLRGLSVAEKYYGELLDELNFRIKSSISAVKNEKHRLIWDNIAIWFLLRKHAVFFGERGCSFIASTYTSAWAETAELMNPDEPMRSMARTYSTVILNQSLGYRFELMQRMINDFNIDGILFHSARSCKPYSLGQYDLKEKLMKTSDVKAIIIEADMTDQRLFSEAQSETRLEAFIESLGGLS